MIGVITSDLEPLPTTSSESSSLNMDENNLTGDSLSNYELKRKRSGSDSIVVNGGTDHQTTPDLSQPVSPSSLKGKGKVKELHLNSQFPAISPEAIAILNDTPEKKESSNLKGKGKAVYIEPKPKKPKEDLLGGYPCPICFSPPSNATLTPCGHICCGLCLFTAVKTTMQRATMMMAPEGAIARCPVCRAEIPGWDGKGGGVIGLKARAILTL